MATTPGRVQRPAAIGFAVLLLATGSAFLFANQLKSAPADIKVVKRNQFFSPNGDGRRDTEPIVFTIDERGSASVDIVDADGTQIRRIEEEIALRAGKRHRVVWDGRDDNGEVAPDGEYKMRLILGEGRSLLAPRPFFLDTDPPDPEVTLAGEAPNTIVTPGTAVDFTTNPEEEVRLPPEFTVLRTDVSPAREVATIPGERDRADYTWDGDTSAGVPAPPGTYLIQITAYDRAQNATTVPPLPIDGPVPGRAGITVRRVAVQPPARSVPTGAPVNVRVDARGQAFEWSLRRLGEPEKVADGSRPAGKTNVLFDAPTGRGGVYLFEVRVGETIGRAPIAVRSRADNDLLVVLPMITWLGRSPVDQSGDGVPDVFGRGGVVRFPRPFAYPAGSPPELARDVAPLLERLEELEIDFDLATDVDLAFDAPLTDGQGVLFPATARWTTRTVAKRLREFVDGGGRVAVFGPSALTATVTVADSALSRPTPPTEVDAFGGRLGAVRALEAGTPLTVTADDPSLGLLEGFSGRLDGFTRVEELEATGGGDVVAGVGEESTDLLPALSAVRTGDGLVIRVGLPEWGRQLSSGSAAVEQLTANILDLLRGVKPRVRTARG